MYQVHLVRPSGKLFALPVYGTKKTVWDALATHVRYSTYENWVAVTKREHKKRFKLLAVDRAA